MEQLMQLLKPIQNVLEYVVVFLYENVTTNYGLVIILLTIIVRIVLTPLTISQTKSMAKMQRLQPQLQEIQKKNKGDKQKIQQETMEFYKKNSVNPLAGCLPLILQMPVFFALFQVLREPSQKVLDIVGDNFNFLWMNLNERDPYYILVIVMVATMFLSTKMTTTDPKQSKIMYIMPLVFGFISWKFPSGILVYWVTTNIWSIGQQWIVNKIISKQKVKEELKQKKEKLAKKDEISEEELKKIIKKRKKRKKRK
jgi:YidC/Oxa1 family membrane protein insertase